MNNLEIIKKACVEVNPDIIVNAHAQLIKDDDNLDHQSEETINFIAGLLDQK